MVGYLPIANKACLNSERWRKPGGIPGRPRRECSRPHPGHLSSWSIWRKFIPLKWHHGCLPHCRLKVKVWQLQLSEFWITRIVPKLSKFQLNWSRLCLKRGFPNSFSFILNRYFCEIDETSKGKSLSLFGTYFCIRHYIIIVASTVTTVDGSQIRQSREHRLVCFHHKLQ